MRAAVAASNVNQAKGNFDGSLQSYTIGANDQLLTTDQYRPLVIAYQNGAPVHLSDVARVIDDAENVQQAAWMNATPAVILNIQRQPGANIIDVVDRIKALLPQLRASLPPTVQMAILTDRTTTIRASVHDVEFELMLTIALVVLVIFLFLRTLAATVIPSIAVPLSLVGTFGVMYLLGYSLNNLTLMALTISTGFVVDDAIVMIENIMRYIEEGEKPLEAALKGSEQIGFTILSLTVSLIAVLIPLLFMGDIVGRLFREFAVTLSVTILVSAVVSLTLTPMMCARLLHHTEEEDQGRFYRASERVFQRIIAFYGRTLTVVLEHQHAHPGRRRRDAGGDRRPLPADPQGLLSGAGHRRHPGRLRGAADHLVPRDGGQQQELAKAILNDPAVESLSSFIGVDGTNTDAQQRPHPDQPEAARRARRQRLRHHPAPAAEAGEGVEGITLFMQPVQDLSVEDRVSRDAVPVQPRGPRRRRARPVGAAGW